MISLPLYPFTPKQLDIDGHCLSYLDEGHGPVIVMLHGNPTWSFFFRNLVLLLRDRYRLIVPDHLGCGLSDKPRNYPYRLAGHIANVEQLLAHLQVDRYSLVVHDWGGAIGMGVAGRRPGQVQGLVVMNTAAFRSPRIPFRIRICRTPLLGDLLVCGLNGFARPACWMAVTRKMDKETVRSYLAPYDCWRNRIGVLGFVRDIPLSPADPSWATLVEIEQQLAGLRNTPMLLLWGGRDFCFTRHFYDEWQRRFPAAEHHFFPGAGHYLLEDAFAEISPLVEDFFARRHPLVRRQGK